jgi:tRNA nucleotidyltransferase (CCA-adding enzyme)
MTCVDLGARAFLVGGSVRDALMGLQSGDLDITVESPPGDFASAIAEALDGQVLMTSQFSTARLSVGDVEFDLVMARSETYPEPGALPEVAPGSLSHDLARRDFTVNAMAAELSPASWGELVDPHGGQADLIRRVIRVLHAASFRDDATRLLRAARYASRFGFDLTESSLEQALASADYVKTISPDRFRHELERVFDEPRAWAALAMLQEWRVLDAYLPGLELDPEPWARFETARLRSTAERRTVAFGLLALAAGTPSLAASLNLGADASRAVRDVLSLRRELGATKLEVMRPSGLVRWLDRFDPLAVTASAMASADRDIRARLNEYLDSLRHVRPSLDGNDLIALGVPQGPMVGRALEALRDAWLDGQVNSPEQEAALARSFVPRTEGRLD